MNRRLILLCVLCGGVVAGVYWLSSRALRPAITPDAAPATHPAANLQSLQNAIAENRIDDAARLVGQRIPLASNQHASAGTRAATYFQAGDVLARHGRFTAADWCLRQALRLAPTHSPYRLRLSMLLYVCGDYPQALAHWNVLLREGGMDLISLPLLGNRELRWGYEDQALREGHQADPQDPLVLLGLGHQRFQEKDFPASEQYLRMALREAPTLLEAQVRLAQLLFESGRTSELADWLGELDAEARSHVEIWLIRGHIARQADDISGAARCYWEAFQKDPNHLVVNENLTQALFALNRSEHAGSLAERNDSLRRYESICREIHLNPEVHPGSLRSAAEIAERAGCVRDALAWSAALLALEGPLPWALEAQNRLRANLPAGKERTSPQDDLRSLIDLSQYPVPAWPTPIAPAAVAAAEGPAKIQFSDATATAGIDFVFDDGADPTSEETRLFEFTGGGVAVLDFDLDGHPDLYFVQGGSPPALGTPSPPSQPTARPRDQLYRNLDDGSFLRCALQAGIREAEYGQGVSVGDYNADGLADLYVANIGANVLYRNNGDGTFSSVDVSELTAQPAWTTSCLLADLNGDSLPDIYDVCYAPNEMIHLRMCRSGVASVPCDATQPLQAGQDRFYLNQGDGSFEDITEAAALVASDGIGLGIVAADLMGSGQLQVFVANDAKPNFFFINERPPGDRPQFREQAVLRGLAYSGQGIPQAGMGVAADDMDGDGLLDLFVTNFYADYNTLYRQHPGGLFEDATHQAGLQAVSFHQLGFGTQFLDADLDGLPDLVIANGDVVDFSQVTPGRHYAQQPQLLKNLGGGRFAELPAETLGSYFEQAHIGRSLARLDWNGDGCEEFVVSNLRTPSRLLTNTTPAPGRYLDVRLVGTKSNRDAVGAVITVTTDLSRWSKQLTAGDGYMASNQRCRIFGLGESEEIIEIQVRWPSGETERVRGGKLNQTILIVEGTGRSYILD